ncbi:hypothetical protein D3C81_2205330 [compost metagenome]
MGGSLTLTLYDYLFQFVTKSVRFRTIVAYLPGIPLVARDFRPRRGFRTGNA